jgi:glycosyltransferase involved in cell wall biosynthesis
MHKPARVLFISTQPFFEWRGSSIRVKFNVLALESMGYEVDLLAPPIGQDAPEIRSRVIRTWSIPGVKSLSIGPSLPKLIFDFFLLLKGIQLAISRRYDVVHGTEEGGSIAWLISRIIRARCVYEKHSDPASYKKKGLRNIIMSVYRQLEAFTARHSDAVIATGPGLADQAKRYAPNTPTYCISDIPSSLVESDSMQVGLIRDSLMQKDDSILVTYVGSFAEYQGIDLLFKTIPLVLDAAPSVRFVVIGGSTTEIESYSKQLGSYAKRVVFAGRIDPDELPNWLSASDIVLAPRRAGINTPLKILDYFKAGTAIVATDTDANRLILDRDCAKLCEYTPTHFADEICGLVVDPVERGRLANNGRERYETTFNFRVFQNQLETVYQSFHV